MCCLNSAFLRKFEILMVKGSRGSHWRLAVESVQCGQRAVGHIVLHTYKSVEDCLRFLCADRVRKWSCRGVVFLGRLLCDLSLTSSVILNLVFNLELQMQSTFVRQCIFLTNVSLKRKTFQWYKFFFVFFY